MPKLPILGVDIISLYPKILINQTKAIESNYKMKNNPNVKWSEQAECFHPISYYDAIRRHVWVMACIQLILAIQTQ